MHWSVEYLEVMYKNRVENDGKLFEIPALLSCKRGNATENGAKKFKIYVILNFPTLARQKSRSDKYS